MAGCAAKRYETARPALIVMKTPALRYADQGFVYRKKGRVKIQVYQSGRAVMTLSVGKRVCLNHACMAESDFYRKYLHAPYPPGTLAAVLSYRPIYGGESMTCRGDVCRQRIERDGRCDIIYDFDARHARFRDRLNHILIKITEL
jgi:hypothetical protein